MTDAYPLTVEREDYQEDRQKVAITLAYKNSMGELKAVNSKAG